MLEIGKEAQLLDARFFKYLSQISANNLLRGDILVKQETLPRCGCLRNGLTLILTGYAFMKREATV
jgi:hypothetical protein